MTDNLPEREDNPGYTAAIQDASHLATTLTQQFITIAIGCIGFTLGMSFTMPSLLATSIFWGILTVFGFSIIFGLLFLMHTIALLSKYQMCDVYKPSLRILSLVQIALTIFGVGLLCLYLNLPKGLVRK